MMSEKNEIDSELVALVGTGTKSVETIFSKYGKTIQKRAAPNLKNDEAFGIWESRVIFEIMSNDKLAPILNTRKGTLSVYTAINRAAVLGLMIGGSKPQAYFVPRDGSIKMEPKDDGMIFACVYGPGAVLAQEPKLVKVFDGDKLRVDEAAGRIIYPESVSIFGEGKLAGYAMELEYIDGRREVKRITVEKCKEIENKYGLKSSPLYTKSPEEADEKTAIKQLLKRPFAMAEGRAMMLALGGTIIPETGESIEPIEPPRDQGERLSSRLDAQMRTVEPEPDEPVEPEEEPEETPVGDDGKPKDLF
jgi:recombinational DNA repair protein RecT